MGVLPSILITSFCAIAVSSCSLSNVESATEKSSEIYAACDFLYKGLTEEQEKLGSANSALAERNRKLAKEDSQYAEALAEYPELNSSILLLNNWDQHALRVISIYVMASKMVSSDLEFKKLLKDSADVWEKRLIVYQTPPSKLDGDLTDQQIKLDMKEAQIYRPYIRLKCGIPKKLLP